MIYDARPMLYDGQVCVVTSVRDVSELKTAEAEIRRQREALHQTEKLSALGTLLAGVAHELNNPLSVVVGHASLLREQAHDPGTRSRAERIHTAAERCARIVKTFLAMARQKPPSWGVVRAEQAVEGALELAAYQLRTAGVAIERDLPADLPPVWGDADQLHQVLTNLVVNAHQALLQVAPPRRLAVRARRLGVGEVAITVEDNGPGMREEVRKRVFEPFFTTKPQGVGTGIGLAVCHAIVTAHRGRILIDSAPGAGTRMTVILPVAEAEPAPGPAPSLGSSAPRRAPGRSWSTTSPRSWISSARRCAARATPSRRRRAAASPSTIGRGRASMPSSPTSACPMWTVSRSCASSSAAIPPRPVGCWS